MFILVGERTKKKKKQQIVENKLFSLSGRHTLSDELLGLTTRKHSPTNKIKMYTQSVIYLSAHVAEQFAMLLTKLEKWPMQIMAWLDAGIAMMCLYRPATDRRWYIKFWMASRRRNLFSFAYCFCSYVQQTLVHLHHIKTSILYLPIGLWSRSLYIYTSLYIFVDIFARLIVILVLRHFPAAYYFKLRQAHQSHWLTENAPSLLSTKTFRRTRIFCFFVLSGPGGVGLVLRDTIYSFR